MRSASFCFLFIVMMLSAQAQAFDEGGLAYTITSSTSPFTVEVTGRASGNSATDINIPDTVTSNGITYSVTTIADSAFRSNSLTSLTLPDSVTTIGNSAFNGNNLNTVTIPDSVTTIGASAFRANALTSVTIGNSVETIGDSAFFDNALTSVTIGNSVETIGDSAFAFNNLTSVTIGNSVTTIGNSAFNGNSLMSLTIGSSVTTIGARAFYDNYLSSVAIGNSVETIGDEAFSNNDLTIMTIGNSVTTIGDEAFSNNDLTSVTFLGNFGAFNPNMFTGNSNLTTITYVQGKTDWPATFTLGASGSVAAIPSTFDQGDLAYLITSANTVEVANRASGSAATDINIPDTVTSNGITYSVTTIADSAFLFKSLTSVTIGNSVTTIGNLAFYDNDLISLTIPDSVTTIGNLAFTFNELNSLTIPDSVTTIGDRAFDTNNLTSVTFLGNFGTFNLNMFTNNPNLTTITYVQGKTDWPQTFTPAGSGNVAATNTFVQGDLAYLITSGTTVEVTGRASGSAATDINIPDTVTSNGITYSVTTIADSAFLFKSLTSVTIGNSVTTIGDAAFYDNDLISLTLPDSVTTIEGNAFSKNDLASVTFLGDFGAFNPNMFTGNSNLTTITYVQGKTGWPQTFTPAGSGNVAATNTFEHANLAYLITSGTTVEVTGRASGSAATDINIPDTVTSNGITYSVTTIADSAFLFKSLTSVTIGNSVTTIGDAAFYDNDLISLTLPDSVTTIEGNAFSKNDLASVTFLGDFGAFNPNMFTGNSNLTTITYVQGKTGWPQTFTPAGSGNVAATNTFEHANLAYLITSGTTVEVTGRASGNSATETTIPDAVTSNGTTYSVTTIGDWAFSYNNLSSLTIGNNVTNIGALAFINNDLTSLTIPDSVTTIGNSAFSYNNLNTVTIPNSVTTIGARAFETNNLTSVTIGNSVTTIGNLAFYDNDLISLTIPDSVTTIGNLAFTFNELNSLTIPDSVTTIGDRAFDTNNLTSVNFLGNFGAFNPNMFTGNSNLTTITYVQGKAGWPQTFTPAGSGSVAAIPSTFDQGDLAYLITSANTVTVTGRASNNSATEITIPNAVTSNGTTYSVTTIGVAAFAGNNLTSVTIGNSVTTIGAYTFAQNELNSLTIGNNVTTIGDSAFYDNELISLTIPDSVTTIGNWAFDTNNLTSVNFLGNFGAFNPNMFTGNSNLTTITYVQGKAGWPQTFTPAGSGSVTTTSLPTTPQITYIESDDQKVLIRVSVASNGGSSITRYDATCSDGTNSFAGTSSSSLITVSGLTNGVAYTCTVTATNGVGTSTASSASAAVTPEEMIPSGLPIWLLYEATQSG